MELSAIAAPRGMRIVGHYVPLWMSAEPQHVLKLWWRQSIWSSGGCYKIIRPLAFAVWASACVCVCADNVVTTYFWKATEQWSFKVICVCMLWHLCARNQRQWLNVLKHRWSNRCSGSLSLVLVPSPCVSLTHSVTPSTPPPLHTRPEPSELFSCLFILVP